MRLIIIALALLLTGCMHEAIDSHKVGKDITVELLFVHEGVKVYRFNDGDSHYYAVPTNGYAASTFDMICGGDPEVCTAREIQTLARR